MRYSYSKTTWFAGNGISKKPLNLSMTTGNDKKCTIDSVKDLDENLPWLTQKTEEPKSNKGNFTFPTHTVNVIDM